MAQSALEQRLVLECLGLRIDVYVNELHATTRMATFYSTPVHR